MPSGSSDESVADFLRGNLDLMVPVRAGRRANTGTWLQHGCADAAGARLDFRPGRSTRCCTGWRPTSFVRTKWETTTGRRRKCTS